MTTISIPVGAQPVLRATEDRPVIRPAGAAIGVIVPIYKKSADNKHYTADSDPTDAETSVVVGITITKADADGDKIAFVYSQGQVIDFGGTLTKGDVFYLKDSTIAEYADITVGHQIVRLGTANEAGDFIVDIFNQDEVKT